MSDKKVCSGCQHWYRYEGFSNGQCRAHPPTVFLNRVVMYPDTGQNFPSCGEYVAVDPATPPATVSKVAPPQRGDRVRKPVGT